MKIPRYRKILHAWMQPHGLHTRYHKISHADITSMLEVFTCLNATRWSFIILSLTIRVTGPTKVLVQDHWKNPGQHTWNVNAHKNLPDVLFHICFCLFLGCLFQLYLVTLNLFLFFSLALISSQSSDYVLIMIFNNLRSGGLMYWIFHMELHFVEPFMKPGSK